MKDEILVIPDVHGRTFWREPIMFDKFEHIVFLGDYFDPYPMECISEQDALVQFADILKCKKANPHNITLLIGNHDAHYWWMEGKGCRYSNQYDDILHSIFRYNEQLFKLVHTLVVCGKTYVFSHAGVMPEWLHDNKLDNVMYEDLNELLFRPNIGILKQASCYRGGNARYPSPIWADMYDINDSKHREGVYQIFGHTQSTKPSIMIDWACLDCKMPYVLNTTTGLLMPWESERI